MEIYLISLESFKEKVKKIRIMKQLDESKNYYLTSLNEKERNEISKVVGFNIFNASYLCFVSNNWVVSSYGNLSTLSKVMVMTNAKELFEEENKSGWYKFEKHNGNNLFYVDYNTKTYYGFDYNGEWFENIFSHFSPNLITATNEEVEQRLIEEAKRRYKETDKVKCLYDNKEYLFKNGIIHLSSNRLYAHGAEIMKDGIWSEIEVQSAFKDLHDCYKSSVFYYHKSKHGDNFYRVLEVVDVKNEFHDWRKYVKYQQTGSNLIFHKPEDMFYQEFKKVEV